MKQKDPLAYLDRPLTQKEHRIVDQEYERGRKQLRRLFPDPAKIARKIERITGVEVKVQQVPAPRFELFDVWLIAGLNADIDAWVQMDGPTLKAAERAWLAENLLAIKAYLIRTKGEACAISQCGRTYPLESPQLDHIVPRSHGRNDRLSNLQLLCRACHEAKTGRIMGPKQRKCEAYDNADWVDRRRAPGGASKLQGRLNDGFSSFSDDENLSDTTDKGASGDI